VPIACKRHHLTHENDRSRVWESAALIDDAWSGPT